jgi:predicted RNase H-like HicB family nuclease
MDEKTFKSLTSIEKINYIREQSRLTDEEARKLEEDNKITYIELSKIFRERQVKEKYLAIFSFEKDGINVVFPDLKGCITFGKTKKEALENAKEVLTLHLEGLLKENLFIPSSSKTAPSLKKSEKSFFIKPNVI